MRRSTLIAILIATAVAGWLASPHLGLGSLGPSNGADGAGDATTNGALQSNGERITAVRTRLSTAEPMAREIVLNGRTEANRVVRIAAETSGHVVEISKRRGEAIEAGDLLVRLDQRDREAALAEARAKLEQRRIEEDAARRLGERGFQAETRVAEAKATLEFARYNLRRAEVALTQTEITAPFAGVLEERPVEMGSFVDIGETVGQIVDLDPIVVVTDVPEASIAQVQPGSTTEIRLVDGSRHQGTVRFVARQANERTRTFRVEAEVPNPSLTIPAGISTEVAITLEPVPAHPVSPGILVLADDGVLGVKSVDDEGTVVFHAVDIIRAEAATVWLAGLPERLDLVVVGQGFVSPGQKVSAVDEEKVRETLTSRAPGEGAVP